jgi:hypothetical protein
MMESKQNLKEARIGMLVALAWLSFLACNKNDQLLAPEKSDLKPASNFQTVVGKLSSNFQTAALKSSSDDDLATICKRDKKEIGTSTALIGPAGGVLKRSNHQLVIPAGALNKTVKISFSILASPYLECELKPYGLKFNKPVRLILSYNGACDSNLDESALKVAYYNPQTQLGVLIPTAIDTELNTVTVELEKFAFSTSNVSRYGLIKR